MNSASPNEDLTLLYLCAERRTRRPQARVLKPRVAGQLMPADLRCPAIDVGPLLAFVKGAGSNDDRAC